MVRGHVIVPFTKCYRPDDEQAANGESVRIRGRLCAETAWAAGGTCLTIGSSDHRALSKSLADRATVSCSRRQNTVLWLFDVAGIGALTSQCSTSLPSLTRKMSTVTFPCGPDRPVQWA